MCNMLITNILHYRSLSRRPQFASPTPILRAYFKTPSLHFRPNSLYRRHLPKFCLQDLARRIPRQGSYLSDLPGDFVVGQLAAQEVAEGLFFQRQPVVQSHERNWLLAFARISSANDGCFLYAWKLIDDLFDFPPLHIDAIHQQHVFLAVGDIKVTLLVAVTDVSGEQPAVAHSFRAL